MIASHDQKGVLSNLLLPCCDSLLPSNMILQSKEKMNKLHMINFLHGCSITFLLEN